MTAPMASIHHHYTANKILRRKSDSSKAKTLLQLAGADATAIFCLIVHEAELPR